MKVIIEELIDAPYYKASYPQVNKANRFTSLIEYQSTVTEKAILSELNKDDKKECLFKTLKNKNEYFLKILDTNFNLRVWIKRFLNKNSKSDKGFFFGTHDLL